MTFYRTFSIFTLWVVLFSAFSGIAAAAEPSKSDNKAAQAELQKRVDELQAAMANLGETLSTQANDSTASIKTDVQKQLEILSQQLRDVKKRIAGHAGESQDAIRRDLGSLLKELGDTLNSAGSNLATPAGAAEPKTEEKK